MSIRVRLTLWYVALLCLGLGLFAGLVVLQVQSLSSTSLDDSLRQRATGVVADLRTTPSVHLVPGSPDESSRQLGEASFSIRVFDARGRVVVREGPALPAGGPSPPLDRPGGLSTYVATGGVQVRVATIVVKAGGKRVATVQAATTTHILVETQTHLFEAMAGAGLLIVAGAALGGFLLAERALRPIDRITRLAAGIGAGDLQQRVGDIAWAHVRKPRRLDEVGRLAQTFDDMLARLQEADVHRRRLTADAAHELGTPITTIAASAEIALRRPRDSASYEATLTRIAGESRHMARIVEDLVLLASADAGDLVIRCELIEIDEVCTQACVAFAALAEEKNVTLHAPQLVTPVLVWGDEVRLGQVVRNVLDNALRHTPPGGSIAVRLAERAGAAPEVVLTFEDTGEGIAWGEEERVFERFHRGPHGVVSRRATGSGLGLAICRAIVTAHGGTITVERQPPGKGACIIVVLPRVATADEDRLV